MPPREAFDAIHGGGVIAAMLLLLLLSMVIGWYVYLALMMPTNLIFHMGFSAWQKLYGLITFAIPMRARRFAACNDSSTFAFADT